MVLTDLGLKSGLPFPWSGLTAFIAFGAWAVISMVVLMVMENLSPSYMHYACSGSSSRINSIMVTARGIAHSHSRRSRRRMRRRRNEREEARETRERHARGNPCAQGYNRYMVKGERGQECCVLALVKRLKTRAVYLTRAECEGVAAAEAGTPRAGVCL